MIVVPIAGVIVKLMFGGGFGVGIAFWRWEVGGWCLVRGG